jgi:hypothetical protein
MHKVFIILVLFVRISIEITPQFYEFKTDNIEDYSIDEFKENVLNSNRITFLEFYAHWCKHSIKFIERWKEFANETKFWHNVLRVAAIDCYRNTTVNNNEICNENNITAVPQTR